jgi:thioredoxin 1
MCKRLDKSKVNWSGLTGKGKVIVKVSTTWCSPCKKIQPLVEELATKYSSVAFYEIPDFDKWSKTERHQIPSVHKYPTFFFFKDGKLIEQRTCSRSNLKEKICKYLGV